MKRESLLKHVLTVLTLGAVLGVPPVLLLVAAAQTVQDIARDLTDYRIEDSMKGARLEEELRNAVKTADGMAARVAFLEGIIERNSNRLTAIEQHNELEDRFLGPLFLAIFSAGLGLTFWRANTAHTKAENRDRRDNDGQPDSNDA